MFAQGRDKYSKGNVERIRLYGLPAAADNDTIREYFDHLAHKHSVDYRHHIKSALRCYYEKLKEMGAIREVPHAIISIPIRKNGFDKGRESQILNETNISDLREYFGNSGKITVLRDRLIFECLASLGIRKSELLLLRYSDFKADINQVHIRSTKTEGKSKYGGARVMPLPDDLADMVKKYCHVINANSLDDNVITIRDYRIWEIIKTAGEAVGIPWLHPHAFRHYCITKFSQLVGSDGATPIFSTAERSAMFGVSPEVIANTYDHPNTENIVSKALKSGVYSSVQ